ncbi:MAG: HEAT repeat domain-containing protein [Planctomycetes bacterium]|nr:HEAT repeat domain-containing protein [Planctomycetota bacterium]
MNRIGALQGSTLLVLLVLCGAQLGPAWAKDPAADDITAIKYLGTVDCYWYPEAQSVLLDILLGDPREKVRYAAVRALTQQLQRGKPPLDPLLGWRAVPDPLIFAQVVRLGTLRTPLTTEELVERYSELKFQREQKKGLGRGDTCHGCCTQDAIAALSRVAFGKDETGCYFEPSERIRLAAERALSLCVYEVSVIPEAVPEEVPAVPPAPVPPGKKPPPQKPAPPETAPAEPTPVTELPAPPALLARGRRPSFGPRYMLNVGRADLSNRFNLFDNMGTAPATRVFFGFQYLQSQNNAVLVTDQHERLFSILATETGRRMFIEYTGFGSGQGTPGGGGDILVDPTDPASQTQLESLYLSHNTGGVTRTYTRMPNTNLYRFGFEYALTLDFSVAMQAQYVMPLDEVEQPEMFSNPLIQLKHVVYRGERSLLSAVFGISPQIPQPDFAITEKTTRLGPGVLGYYEVGERLFTQGGTGFSLPTQSQHIKTWDWALGMGLWVYQHESLKPTYEGPEPDAWVLGIVPQLQVRGKHVIGDNIVRGQFGLSAEPPKTAEGTLSPVDATRTIYLPQDPSTPVTEVPIFYNEPRHVVDMSFGTTILFRDNVQLMLGISFPLTGGQARATEFLMTVNRFF